MPWKKWLIRILSAITICYIGACGYLYFFQRNMLYLPDKSMRSPEKYGLPSASLEDIKTRDGILIKAWYIQPKANMPILLYFQGNSGSLGRRNKKFQEYTAVGFGLLAVSYRGYGGSQGQPTEEGLYNDARASVDFLINHGVDTKNIVIYGESLGTGVAVQLASEIEARALILEAPYDTIGSRAAEVYPFFPVNLLLKDRYLSVDKINKIHIPVLVFHSKDDKTMPIWHGIKLFKSANEPKEMVVFDAAGHNNFDYHKLATLILDFVNKNATTGRS